MVVGACLAVVGLGGYYAVSMVSGMKEEAGSLTAHATELSMETNAIQQKISEQGSTDEFGGLAANRTSRITSLLAERKDFAKLSDQILSIRPTTVWIETTTLGESGEGTADPAATTTTSPSITIKGYSTTMIGAESFVVRLQALSQLDNVELTEGPEKSGKAYSFTITATVAAAEAGVVTGDGGAQVVSNSSSAASELALTPTPTAKMTVTKSGITATPKPKPKLSALEQLGVDSSNYSSGGGS